MKLLHLADLHLGKRVNEFNMREDQDYILEKILSIADAEAPDAVLMAGDIYDKSTPSADAVSLFNRFLTRLSERRFGGRRLSIFIISGNHDSPERLSFGSRLMEESRVYFAPVYDGTAAAVELTDDYGPAYVHMLPFVKPVDVRQALRRASKEAEADAIQSYTDAIRAAISQMNVNPAVRNILVTHQFVTGAARSESENISVGGADNVDASAFDVFDYVALGHLHGPQRVGRETLRYSGSPLKYSFSEAKQKKSVTVVELGEKGAVSVRTVPLIPKHDLRELRGAYEELTLKRNYEGTATDDYLHITLTDEDDIPDAVGKRRIIYPNLMKLDYDNLRTRSNRRLEASENMERQSPIDLFAEFYEKRNNQPLSEKQAKYARELMESVWEERL